MAEFPGSVILAFFIFFGDNRAAHQRRSISTGTGDPLLSVETIMGKIPRWQGDGELARDQGFAVVVLPSPRLPTRDLVQGLE